MVTILLTVALPSTVLVHALYHVDFNLFSDVFLISGCCDFDVTMTHVIWMLVSCRFDIKVIFVTLIQV